MEADMKETRTRENKYWVCAVLPLGKIYVDGGYDTYDQAYRAAATKPELIGRYEIKEYPTINLQAANGFFKHELAEQENSLALIAQRVKHQV